MNKRLKIVLLLAAFLIGLVLLTVGCTTAPAATEPAAPVTIQLEAGVPLQLRNEESGVIATITWDGSQGWTCTLSDSDNSCYQNFQASNNLARFFDGTKLFAEELAGGAPGEVEIKPGWVYEW